MGVRATLPIDATGARARAARQRAAWLAPWRTAWKVVLPFFKPTLFLVAALVSAQALADRADVIARLKPSVVIVGSYRATDAPRFRLRGTGFVVDGGNRVITNFHVLPGPSEDMANATLVVQVRSAEGQFRTREANVVDTDRAHDLALLRFEGPAAPAMSVRDSSDVREGQDVAFMGFPIGGALGFSTVTHRGMISSITPAVQPTPTARQLNESTIRGARAGSFDIFQLDATAYPGNSGGPLFDPATGEVLGVVNMVFIKGSKESALTQPSGISYAVPSRFILELLSKNPLAK